MSRLLLMEELDFLSGKMVYLVKMGSHHGWGSHMLRCVGISKNMPGDQIFQGTLSETLLKDQ